MILQGERHHALRLARHIVPRCYRHKGRLLLYTLTMMLPPPKRFTRAPFLARFRKLHMKIKMRANRAACTLRRGATYAVDREGWAATTPAIRRVARARFARLRVLGEGTAKLVHKAWDDAIWRTRRSPQGRGSAGLGSWGGWWFVQGS